MDQMIRAYMQRNELLQHQNYLPQQTPSPSQPQTPRSPENSQEFIARGTEEAQTPPNPLPRQPPITESAHAQQLTFLDRERQSDIAQDDEDAVGESYDNIEFPVVGRGVGGVGVRPGTALIRPTSEIGGKRPTSAIRPVSGKN